MCCKTKENSLVQVQWQEILNVYFCQFTCRGYPFICSGPLVNQPKLYYPNNAFYFMLLSFGFSQYPKLTSDYKIFHVFYELLFVPWKLSRLKLFH